MRFFFPVLAMGCLFVFDALAHTGITAKASVSVSDGLRYDVVTVYRDQYHAVFHREYPDRRVTQVVDGAEVWQHDGETRQVGNAFIEMLVLGHQFHALISWPEQFFTAGLGDARRDEQCQCLVSDNEDRFGNRVLLRFNASSRRLISNTTQIKNGPEIEYRYDDWRLVGTREWPFTILIDDGSREFAYSFRELSFDPAGFETFEMP